MRQCPHCASSKTSPRSRLTSQGYATFYCNNCRRGFNERTNSPFNRAQVPTPIIFEVVLWRLRYKLSLKDLAEMFWTKGFYFTKETVRLWEAKYAPLLTDELKTERKGQVTNRWKADETMIRIKKKLFYLYRAIDSNGKLVDVRLSEVRDTESTAAFFAQAVETTNQKPEQNTSDKDTTYPPAIEKVLGRKVEHRANRYANNRMEQDHRGIKSRYRPMQGFKNVTSAERFCASFDEQRNFFKFRRWHNDRWKAGWQRADFKRKFYRLKNKFINRKLIWKQSVMAL